MIHDDDLLSGYLDDALDETDIMEVRQRLVADPVFAKRCVELSRLHANLRLLGHDRAAIERHGVSPPRPLTRSHRRRAVGRRRSRQILPWIALTSAAAVMIALVLRPMIAPMASPAEPLVGYELIADGTAVAVDLPDGSKRSVPDRLRLPQGGTITTARSGARLVTTDGSEIFVAATSTITVTAATDQHDIVVEQGSATFHITPQTGSHHFQTKAGSLAVAVIGTRFRLENTDQRSLVSVEHGTVEARVADGAPFRLTAGQSAAANGGAFLLSGTSLPMSGPIIWQWQDDNDAKVHTGERVTGADGRRLRAIPADITVRPGITTPAPYAICSWVGTNFPKLHAGDYLVAQVRSGPGATWIGTWLSPNQMGSQNLHIETKAVPESWMTLVVPILSLQGTQPGTPSAPVSETAVERLTIQGDGDGLFIRDIRIMRVP